MIRLVARADERARRKATANRLVGGQPTRTEIRWSRRAPTETNRRCRGLIPTVEFARFLAHPPGDSRMQKKLGLAVLLISVASHSFSADWPQWRGANRDAKVGDFKAP